MSGSRRAYALVLLAIGPLAIVEACTSHVPEYALDGGTEGGEAASAESQPPGDSQGDGGADGATEEAPLPQTHLRFALWSPDAPGADFCIRPHLAVVDGGSVSGDAGDDWQGPLIGQRATLVDGGINVVFPPGTPSGLAFAQASAYFDFPAGAYDARIVAAGSADCTTPLVGTDATHLASFGANAFSTIAAIGDYQQAASDPELTMVAFSDDGARSSGHLKLRFIMAVPSVPSLDLGVGTLGSPSFAPLFSGVAFGATGTAKETDAGKVDSANYLLIAPLANVTLSAIHQAAIDAGSTLLVADDVNLPGNSVATLVAVGGKSGGAPPLPQFALCLDTASPVNSVFADCRVLGISVDAGDGGPSGDAGDSGG
jgi:hypothetical protein